MSIEPSTMNSKTIFTLNIIPSIIRKYFTYCFYNSMKICNLLLELSNSVIIILYPRLRSLCNWNEELVAKWLLVVRFIIKSLIDTS